MNRIGILGCHSLLAAGLVLLAGCGGAYPPADPSRGEEAVKTAFEGWKKGETPEALRQGSPAIYLNEPEFTAGNKLLSFEIVEPLTPTGRQLRCTMKLSLQGAKSGAKYEKSIGYQVDTDPAFVIAREDL